MGPYDDVNPGDGFERWHQVTCRNYSLTECRPVPDSAFDASVVVRPFGGLAISRIGSTVRGGARLCVTRGSDEIRRDQRDDYFLWLAREGAILFEQKERSVVLRPGDLMLHDQARPFTLAFSETAAATMIIVPRSLMEARVPHAAELVARRIDGHAPWSRLAASLAGECADPGTAAAACTSPRLWLAALDIWAGVLAAGFVDNAAAGDRSGRRLQQVKTFLLRHLDDAELDTESVARRMNMSGRTLMRLFAAEGATPMRWLWNERLRACRFALEQGRFDRVTDAAFAFGFRNLSHFSRSFKALHGCTPLQALKDGGAD